MDSKVTLNNNQEISALGLGTWKSQPNLTSQAVLHAIRHGYRHIDCAFCYENQDEVGTALQQAISEGVAREDLFITSKLWVTHLRREDVQENLRETLGQLKLQYLDLFLIHWPYPLKKLEPYVLLPEHENVPIAETEDIQITETWAAMEELVDLGLVKSIGLSNFTQQQTSEILDVCRIKPVVNQVECHPFLNQVELKQFLDSQDIKLVAYSPLGNYFPGAAHIIESPFTNDVITAIAREKNKTKAQILLRWQLQKGHIVIPKSVTPKRIEENANITNFELSEEDMEKINELGQKNIRYCNPHFRPNGELAFPGETTAFFTTAQA